ncbi:TonB-dependent receptor [Glaciecola sp. MH2013]|uniref:TonB-dependent receptor n=1 Tax=Glaciecola sp. MH2013 TaxID=2785524 RepID=UPI00189CE1BD|nr:TonB-dependent receptor [Glaciecola sp. MH2013]MBF7072101.1 TonB-dependent receptor [Glaciecola sp. MH2013]
MTKIIQTNTLGKPASKPAFLASSIALILTFPFVNAKENDSLGSLERIEVRGIINNGSNRMMQSEIDLADGSAPDLRGQIEQLPGLSVNGNGLVSGVVQYRGLFGDRLKVKVDDIGIAGAGPNAMDSPLSHVLGNRQELVLHQGIAPVSLGSESLGGAIEIRDLAPEFNSEANFAVNSELSAGYFANNKAQLLGANLHGANKTTYINFQGQYQEAENYESGNGLLVPSTFYERSGMKLRAGYHHNDSELDLVIGHRNTNESGTPALAMDIIYVDSLWYKLNYANRLNDKWKVTSKIYGNQNEHAMNNFQLRPASMAAMHRLNTVDSEALGVDIELMQLERDDAEGFSTGISYYKQNHNSRITNPNNGMFFIQNFNDVQRDISSLYAQYEFETSSSSRLLWQIGGRASRVDLQANEVGSNMVMMSPAVASVVNRFNDADRQLDFFLLDLVVKAQMPLSKHTVATFSAGQKERAPSYHEVYSWFPLGVSAGLADGRNYIGNLDLEKESALKADIGFQYQKDNTSVLASLFYQKVSDYIIGVPSNNMPINMITNMMGVQQALQWNNKAARLYGIDAYFSVMLSPHLQFSTSAQYVDGKLSDGINGQELALYRLTPLSGNMALNWQHNAWDIAFVFDVAAAQTKVSPLQNEAETAGYGVWNVKVDYKVNAAMDISFIIENLADKDYATHLGGVNRVRDENVALGQKVPEAGRNLGLHLNYRF